DVRERHRGLAGSRSVELVSRSSVPTRVRADPVRLAQALDNLVGNALRYTPAGGRVELGLATDGVTARISVRDDGPGLAPDQAALVFERFYRADPSRSRDAGGSGLGLAITKSLVEAMGGSVTVASAGAGRGATFTVDLPAG
ncbi:MAG: HAMP domain-containing histidine kinase, partial [Chloroflexi bacterium]|nr:HAMP domain-containing histidine kinase [Chloroflexota bacterium]